MNGRKERVIDGAKSILSTRGFKVTSEVEKEESLNLLSNPSLLEKFLDDTENLGCVGEDENKVLIYMALTSRKLEDPINLNVKGESSTGKSFVVKNVAQFFH